MTTPTSKLLIAYWYDQLKGALKLEKYLNDGQVEAILTKYDMSVQRNANPESIFEHLLDAYGNVDAHKATAKASNFAPRTINAKTHHQKWNMPKGLEYEIVN